MTENAKQAKGEFWNPGLDNRSSSDSKDDKIVEQHEGHKDVKPQQQPQFVLNNPLVVSFKLFGCFCNEITKLNDILVELSTHVLTSSTTTTKEHSTKAL